jgi:MoxR-like ATPase
MKTRRELSASDRFAPKDVERRQVDASELGDQRGGDLYVYTPKVKLAVKVALATGRPLLVRGPSGWGKSSLAGAVAGYLGWRYLPKVISSRTQARDLMSEVDLVRRLNDAQAQKLDPDWRRYIRPGVLWKAFDPEGAQRQEDFFARTASGTERAGMQEEIKPAVVLLDEMDKADPDVPNNLLVALGSLQFDVDEIGPPPIKAKRETAPLIIVTTNDERDLPQAFLRRCIELELPALDGDDANGSGRKELLIGIGAEHLHGLLDRAFIAAVVDKVIESRRPEAADGPQLPSPAELIDTLRAVHELYGSKSKAEDIVAIAGITVSKRGRGASAS